MRKKRCTNPACRKVFSYAPGGDIDCPWCGESFSRSWKAFRFGVDRVPALREGRYIVRLDRPAVYKKLYAIKALRNASVLNGGSIIRLKEAKEIMDRVWAGQPYELKGQTAGQVRLLMREGQMDLSFRRCGQ